MKATRPLIGREEEIQKIRACIRAGRNLLLEGPVGVGKTHLALSVIEELGLKSFRIDGDSRYTEQKLAGWFDPPVVLKKGYGKDSFVPGPLVEAMTSGGILFINELNRLPEGVQNILLPAIDERMILVPRLGQIDAQAGFTVLATQNPKEFVATSHLSEAILDRFELVMMTYQSEAQEIEIVQQYLQSKKLALAFDKPSVLLVRATREHPRIRRGASIRAAMSIAELALALQKEIEEATPEKTREAAFIQAALMALPTRIEIEREADHEAAHLAEVSAMIRELAARSSGSREFQSKKKVDAQTQGVQKLREKASWSSVEKTASHFLPPEAFGAALDYSHPEESAELAFAGKSHWDIATRYHEFKSFKRSPEERKKLRKISAQAILERAQQVMGAVVHPIERKTAPQSELPWEAQQVEVDLEETFENSISTSGGEGELWMEYHLRKPQSVILSVDTSLSMTGEKLALTAVALAVVLLQFPHDPVGIVAFENVAQVLKRPDEKLTLEALIERFLDVPAQGYTHLEEGLKASLKLQRTLAAGARRASTVLLTDGKYTAGKDPAYLAPRFSHLVVMKMGKEKASLALCQEMAQKGQGTLKEVAELESLPTAMYSVVKDLLRGKSR